MAMFTGGYNGAASIDYEETEHSQPYSTPTPVYGPVYNPVYSPVTLPKSGTPMVQEAAMIKNPARLLILMGIAVAIIMLTR